MKFALAIFAAFGVLLAAPLPAQASKALSSPASYVNPNTLGDSFLCIVSNVSTNTITVDVAIVDGTGSSAYCGGVSSIMLPPGALQGFSCPLNPNNFASRCQISSKHTSAVRGNHCLVDSSSTAKICAEVR